MSERLGSHALALGLELEKAIPVETPGFSNDAIDRASVSGVLAGPSMNGLFFVPFTVMFDASSSDRYRRFCKAFHTGDERLREDDSRRRVMTDYGTIFSLQEKCGDPFTLVGRAKIQRESIEEEQTGGDEPDWMEDFFWTS